MQIIVNNCSTHTRIDKFLKKKFPYLNQGIIERAARKGHVKINNIRAKSNMHVKNEDVIVIMDYLAAVTGFEGNRIDKQIKEDIATQTLAAKVVNDYKIAETSDYIIINKPAPLATQGGSKILLSLDDALKYLNKHYNCDFKLVHRIDKDTTGVLIIAKGHASAVKLTTAFAERLITKEYLAILYNIPQVTNGIINSNITKIGNRVVTNQLDGKSSITKYRVLAISQDMQLSLLSFMPVTGRTHQIRVHATALGCYIVGDKKYGTVNCNRLSQYSLKLHAHKVKIKDSVFGIEVNYSAALPNEFQYIINRYFQCKYTL